MRNKIEYCKGPCCNNEPLIRELEADNAKLRIKLDKVSEVYRNRASLIGRDELDDLQELIEDVWEALTQGGE